jgi:integrase
MPPAAPTPKPKPPSAREAARLVTEAWKDPDWGAMVWVAMTTGARRGELCGLRWSDIDHAGAVIMLHKSRAQVGREQWEKDTKTHQQRRIALDAETVIVLEEHLARCAAAAKSIGVKLAPDAFVFSRVPDGLTPLSPDSVTQRYRRMAVRIKIDTTIHALRHYSATELIASGIDIRTVAGRLGHGGGGATTLRVYAAWVSEADQRAAETIGPRMPARPRIGDGDVKKARAPRPKVRASNKRAGAVRADGHRLHEAADADGRGHSQGGHQHFAGEQIADTGRGDSGRDRVHGGRQRSEPGPGQHDCADTRRQPIAQTRATGGCERMKTWTVLPLRSAP